MSRDWGTTERVAAIITLADGEVVPGYLHVQSAVSHRDGVETPLEMLNRPEGFFPLTDDEDGVCFLSKAQVVMVMCEWAETELDEEVEASARTIALHVTLGTGEEFDGQATVLLPPPRARPLDYVNSLAPFFLLKTEGGPRLINRAHVHLVRPLQ